MLRHVDTLPSVLLAMPRGARQTPRVPSLSRADRCTWRLAPDGSVLVHSPAGNFDLVGVAAMIWVLLDEPRDWADVASELDRFGVVSPLVDDTLASLRMNALVDEHD